MADIVDKGLKKAGINVSTPILAVICIVFGILLFILPQLVGYIIGLFLLIQGMVLLIDYHANTGRRRRTYNSSPSS
ncbi:MAG: hypothetical protein FWG55_09340 [Candidatus Bathyarchaeota archaeon]|nr:hypothetical protein [Candidatus Termiticorpusculum sp.]